MKFKKTKFDKKIKRGFNCRKWNHNKYKTVSLDGHEVLPSGAIVVFSCYGDYNG